MSVTEVISTSIAGGGGGGSMSVTGVISMSIFWRKNVHNTG